MIVMFVSYESKNCDVEIDAHCRLCVCVPVKHGWVSSENYTRKVYEQAGFESSITYQKTLIVFIIKYNKIVEW